MDEVPAIIHRLSLRLWVPEYREKEDEELARQNHNSASDDQPVDPLASPPQNPVDVFGNFLDPSQVASLSLDSGSERHSLFSQKNLLHLAALTDSHRTLSLFTPRIRDAVFRAWTGPSERGELPRAANAPALPIISRAQSWAGTTSHAYTFSDTSDGPASARPALSRMGSTATGFGLGANRQNRPHAGRRKKHRVVNLRKKAVDGEDTQSTSGDGCTISETTSSAQSEYGAPSSSQEREGELVTPPQSPPRNPIFQNSRCTYDSNNTPVSNRNRPQRSPYIEPSNDLTPRPPKFEHLVAPSTLQPPPPPPPPRPKIHTSQSHQPAIHLQEKRKSPPQSSSQHPYQYLDSQATTTIGGGGSGGILEQAWMMKMAGEIARKIHEEKSADSSFWGRAGNPREGDEDVPPPAYGS